MTTETRLALLSPEQSEPLIFDASVAINFLGTGVAGRLVHLLSQPVLMVDRTFAEIRRHPVKGSDHIEELAALIKAGTMKVVPLDAAAKELFYDLASGDISGGLDDGEAATIALAATMSSSAIPVLDDRKAKNLLIRRWPSRRSLYTMDLLASDRVVHAMRKSELADAIYSALFHARMRVPAEMRKWVLDLIGKVRAEECPCLGSVRRNETSK